MREFETRDIFKLSRIIKKMKLRIEDNEVNFEDENWTSELVTVFIQRLIEGIGDAEYEICDFFGSLFGITADEFAVLPPSKSIDLIMEFKNHEGLADFFGKVRQLMKLQ